MIVKQQCVIRYDNKRKQWRVDIGLFAVHFGSIFSCKEWARMNGIPVRNAAEIERILINEQPAWEGLA